MQTDGNFVVYTGANQAVWASGTQGNPGSYVLIQNDGNLVVYKGNQPLWNSGTDLSYIQTCQGISMSGASPTILSGSCKNFFGQWQQSSVVMDGCVGIIGNIDGVLRCVISEDMGFDIVSIPSDVATPGKGETKVWRIDRPNVRVADDPFPSMLFQPGDTITFVAGGCVQTGGSGQTWKSYVNPSGAQADHLYSGTVQITGIIPSVERIAGVIQNSPWPVGSGNTPQNLAQAFLHLGYQDQNGDYGDNGYYSHDNGNNNQCLNVGPAWVEITVVSLLAGQPQYTAPEFSPGSLPFDLIWDINAGVDANGLPLNPIWFSQMKSPPTELDFQNTCRSAFPDGYTINPTNLRQFCTTDSPTADIDAGLDFETFGAVCPANPIHGHLNWGIVTYRGTLTWQGWSGDAGFWDDGDYNFGLSVPNNAGLVSGTPNEGAGLHLEFNESEVEFQGPLWQALFQDVQGSSGGDPVELVNGRSAVVTGLFGIDGVHNGGYSESHPVYAMAVLMNIALGQGTLEETWDFFIRNYGNEGMCSENMHYWDGVSGAYYVEFPWPKDKNGYAASNVSAGATQAWFWSPSGAALPAAPQLEMDQGPPATPTRSYLEVALPGGSGLSGEITLRYTVPLGFAPTMLAKRIAEKTSIVPAQAATQETVKFHSDDAIDPVQIMADPVTRQRVLALPNSYHMAPRRTVVSVKLNPAMIVHKPAAGPATKGLLTRDRSSPDPVKAKWNADLHTAFVGPIIKVVPLPPKPQ